MEKLLPASLLLKKAWHVYRERFSVMAGILLVNVPMLLLIALYSELYYRKSFQDAIAMHGLRPWFFAGFLLLGILFSLVTFWSQLALIFSLKERQSVATARQFLAMAWAKLNQGLWVYFLVTVAVLAGFLLLIIPGIMLAVWFCFSLYVVVDEQLAGVAAIKRSKDLVKALWLPIFLRFVFIGFIVFIISLALGYIPVVGDVVNTFLCMPLSMAYGYLLYEEVKRVKAGLLA